MKGGIVMYSYTFNGITYTANSVLELQMKLEQVGCTDDVIAFFNQESLASLQDDEDLANSDMQEEVLTDFEDDGLNQLN